MNENRKNDRLASLIGKLVPQYLAVASDTPCLITVTNVILSDDRKNADVLFTVFPETQERQALEFCKHSAGEVRNFIETHARVGRVPFLTFSIDLGEKNRQRIEAISVQEQTRRSL